MLLPAIGFAEAQSSAELSRCEIYLQAQAPLMGNPKAGEERNAKALRALNQFRTANLSEFDFSPGDEPVHVETEPSEALAHRISAIINRDGFKLGRQGLNDGGFEALQTRVLANVEEGADAIRWALQKRINLAENSSADVLKNLHHWFGEDLVDETRLLRELEGITGEHWFYHSFDVEAPADVAEVLWRTGHLPEPPQASGETAKSGFGSAFVALIKGFSKVAGRKLQPGENTEVLRVDELLALDPVNQKPILITVLRLAQGSSVAPNNGGGGKKLRTIELRSEAEDIEAELKEKGLVPVKASGRRLPRIP